MAEAMKRSLSVFREGTRTPWPCKQVVLLQIGPTKGLTGILCQMKDRGAKASTSTLGWRLREMFQRQWHNSIGWLRSLVVFQGQGGLLQG
jgi:hypothetical protein